MSFRNWVFTLNNYTEEEEKQIQVLATNQKCKYLIYGKEKSKDGNTPHLQGYLEWGDKIRRNGLRKSCAGFSRAYLDSRKGTPAAAAEYCKKEGDFYEYGKLSSTRQGRRTDLEKIKNDIKAGAEELQIADNHFSQWVVYRNSFRAYRNMVRHVPRTWKSVVVVLWGSTGTGKTRFVFQQTFGGADLFVHGGDRWFDGYDGQRNALFDDFDGTQLEFRFLLRLLDRYPMQVPIKGGFVNWCPRKIYITSNLHPAEWYEDSHNESRPALLRRIEILNEVRENIFDD